MSGDAESGTTPESDSQSLATAQAGCRVRIVQLRGGRHFQQRVVGMGLRLGAEIAVLQSGNGLLGRVVIAVGDTRLALGHGMAEKIQVRSI